MLEYPVQKPIAMICKIFEVDNENKEPAKFNTAMGFKPMEMNILIIGLLLNYKNYTPPLW